MSTLVNPEPRSISSMERWSTFRSRVHAWPLEKLRARAADLVEQHFSDHEGRREALRQNLAEADEDGDLADSLILAALRLGEVTAFISHPPSIHGYALERFAWRSYFKHPDALRAIEAGTAPWPLREFVPQSIERELADRPLFVLTSEANAFLRLKPPSEAQLRMSARALVDEHRDAPLKKSAFIVELLKRCPGCSAHRAGKTWQTNAPATWRSPGRRRRT